MEVTSRKCSCLVVANRTCRVEERKREREREREREGERGGCVCMCMHGPRRTASEGTMGGAEVPRDGS